MKFNNTHKTYLQNVLNILRRAKLPDAANGEEYLAFAQSYYFIYDLLQAVDKEIKADQAIVPTEKPQTSLASPSSKKNTTKTQEIKE